MNTPALDELTKKVEEHRYEMIITCEADCWCWSAEEIISDLAQLKAELAAKTEAVEEAKWKERLNILREIYAESLKYGASYFLGKPMERFSSWLQIQLLETERTYNTWLAKYGKEQK